MSFRNNFRVFEITSAEKTLILTLLLTKSASNLSVTREETINHGPIQVTRAYAGSCYHKGNEAIGMRGGGKEEEAGILNPRFLQLYNHDFNPNFNQWQSKQPRYTLFTIYHLYDWFGYNAVVRRCFTRLHKESFRTEVILLLLFCLNLSSQEQR